MDYWMPIHAIGFRRTEDCSGIAADNMLVQHLRQGIVPLSVNRYTGMIRLSQNWMLHLALYHGVEQVVVEFYKGGRE